MISSRDSFVEIEIFELNTFGIWIHSIYFGFLISTFFSIAIRVKSTGYLDWANGTTIDFDNPRILWGPRLVVNSIHEPDIGDCMANTLSKPSKVSIFQICFRCLKVHNNVSRIEHQILKNFAP